MTEISHLSLNQVWEKTREKRKGGDEFIFNRLIGAVARREK